VAQPVLTLRAFSPGDRFILNRWLAEPHVIAWFGSRSIAEAEIAMAQSSGSALVRIVMRDGQPIGYVQAMDCALLGGNRPAAMPDGSYTLTGFIGAVAERGKGLGALALASLRAELFSTTFAPSVAVMVPLKNERAVRFLEKQGFRWDEVWRDAALGPCWVLIGVRGT
jgi:aminoglycoside 6'-N-acetyltransferase